VNGRLTAARAAISIRVAPVLAASASLGAAWAASGAPFVPDPEADGAPPFEDGSWRVAAPGYAVELKLLDDLARREFAKRRTGSPADPFAPLPGQPSSLLTFLLRIENRGKGDLAFQPDATRILGRDRETFYPVGWPDIQSAYELLGQEVPPAQAPARTLLLDGQKVIRPGGVEEGILMFRAPPPGTKKFRIEIALTLPDGSGAGFQAPYRQLRK
jgi:hypothetical protein